MNNEHLISICCVCNKEFEEMDLQGCINVTHISIGLRLGMHIHFHFDCAFKVLFGNFATENPSVKHKIEITRLLLEKLDEINQGAFDTVN